MCIRVHFETPVQQTMNDRHNERETLLPGYTHTYTEERQSTQNIYPHPTQVNILYTDTVQAIYADKHKRTYTR